MKNGVMNTRKVFGKSFFTVVLVMLAFGMTVIGNLDAQNNNLIGTWVLSDNSVQRIFDNVFFESYGYPSPGRMMGIKGTYVTRGNLLILTPSHIHGSFFGLEQRWYSQPELIEIFRGSNFMEFIRFLFSTTTVTYMVRGNTLTTTAGNDPPQIWYRK